MKRTEATRNNPCVALVPETMNNSITTSTDTLSNYLEDLIAWGAVHECPVEVAKNEQGSLEVVFHEKPE